MFKTKFIFSIIIFVTFLIITSVVKNKTHVIEKKISSLNNDILLKEKNLNEAELDFNYLTSPAELEKKLNLIGLNDYQPIKYSNIYFDISDLSKIQSKISNLNSSYGKKIKKNKNINQRSFYFEDFLETNKRNKTLKNLIIYKTEYIYYFFFFSLILIFSIKITHISLKKKISLI